MSRSKFRILPVRIAIDNGFGGCISYDDWIADGINWA